MKHRSAFFTSILFMRGATLLFWMVMIFTFSSMPGSGTDYDPPLWYVLERKSAHVFEYAVLMFLSVRFMSVAYAKERSHRIMLLAAVFSLTYAVSDELHQFFVFGRGAKMTDVAIDGIGILIMVSALVFLKRWGRKNF